MAVTKIRRRWGRRAIALLIVLNAALWASFAVTGGCFHFLSSIPRTAARSAAQPTR